jgi:putative transposase
MSEHVHPLMTEPEQGDPAVVMKVIKQRFARQMKQEGQTSAALICDRVWQKRFYDFNVWSERKRIEKLRYMHRNPVKRGLVEEPDQWRWSSFRTYFYGELGPVRVNFQEWPFEIKSCALQKFGDRQGERSPLIRKERE